MDFQSHVACFVKLLNDHHVVELLKRDPCGVLCDKYHLIIIFQFFMRAEFQEEDYTTKNFFLALILSHDLYDESKTLKYIILTYYLSQNDGFKLKTRATVHWDKIVLFKRMQFKGFVERKICQKLCHLIKHKAFDRNRKELHTGKITTSLVCEKCRYPVNKSLCVVRPTSDKSKLTTRQKRKRPRKSSPETEENLFFPDNVSQWIFDKKNSVASIC